jgi:hypothetical protein
MWEISNKKSEIATEFEIPTTHYNLFHKVSKEFKGRDLWNHIFVQFW